MGGDRSLMDIVGKVKHTDRFVGGFAYMCECAITEACGCDASMSVAPFFNAFGTKFCLCCGFFRYKVVEYGIILQVLEGILNILHAGNSTGAKSFVGIYNQNVGVTVEFWEES